MLKVNLFVFIFGLCLYSGDCKPKPHDLSWDILVFAQCWSETVCKSYIAKNDSRTCRYLQNQNAWTVHGIWPTKIGTEGPSNCNMTVEFDLNQIKSIEADLEQAWTNIHGDEPEDEFWSKEWYKHGTCALSLESLDTEWKYFNQAIVWLNKYSMTDILSGANIVPSNTKQYQVEDFDKAITAKLGVKPFITCDTACPYQYLHELRICFDKKFNLIDCVPYLLGSSVLTDCNVSQSVVYPDISKKPTKLKRYVDNYWFYSSEENWWQT